MPDRALDTGGAYQERTATTTRRCPRCGENVSVYDFSPKSSNCRPCERQRVQAYRRSRPEWWRFPADWTTHGRVAGPIRNQQMLDEGQPDVVLAFVDKALSASKGTADLVARAERSDVPVYVVRKRAAG